MMAAKEQTPICTFKCALCGDTFETNKRLIGHKSVHAKEKRTFTCSKCNSTFTDHCEYLLHEVTHLHHKTTHKCIECGAMKKKIVLPAHIMMHFGERKQACEFCNVIFTVEELKRHVKQHSVLNNICKCEICGKMLVASKYELHMANHATVKQYHCSFCDKVYKDKSSRDDHIKIHTGEHSEVCSTCGLFFRDVKHLYWHKKQHRSEVKYICDYCQKEFFTKQNIAIHILQHMRGFWCRHSKCKFTARTVEELDRHRSIEHFYCKVCKMGFPNKNSLTRHLVTRLHKSCAYRKNKDVE